MGSTASFTLVELLIVVGILAVLVAITVVTLNPAQLLAQVRDSKRQQDLSALSSVLNTVAVLGFQSFSGTSSVVYVSLPDADPLCGDWILPNLPGDWVYNCVPTSTLQNTDGTGWVPVDMRSNGVVSLDSLPVDPINSDQGGLYYTYVVGGSFSLAGTMESQKYYNTHKLSGANDPLIYEVGSDSELAPFAHGVAAHWNFSSSSSDGQGGAWADDLSGVGQLVSFGANMAIVNGGQCRSGSCFSASGGGYATVIPTSTSANPYSYDNLTMTGGSSFSIGLWVKIDNAVSGVSFLQGSGYTISFDGTVARFTCVVRGSCMTWCGRDPLRYCCAYAQNLYSIGTDSGSTPLSGGQWMYLVVVADRTTGMMSLYVNGNLAASNGGLMGVASAQSTEIGDITGGAGETVYIADTIVYSRALSASEVARLYLAVSR